MTAMFPLPTYASTSTIFALNPSRVVGVGTATNTMPHSRFCLYSLCTILPSHIEYLKPGPQNCPRSFPYPSPDKTD